jgi:hypothetical protein
MKKILFITLTFLALSSEAFSQKLEPIKFGDFENWTSRTIHESGIIGGKDRTVYVIGPNGHIDGNIPYIYGEKTDWSSSNVYAKVAGINKGSNTVEPETRGTGRCARLDTKMEGVKVFGVINVEVLVSGSFFLGKTYEPITNTNDPYAKIEMGIPFTKKPKALVLDYKCLISSNNYVMKHPGVGSTRLKDRQDKGEFIVYLQKRWEDEKGRIYAKRVGTMRFQLDHNVPEWQNATRFPIHYGDISKTEYYKDFMKLSGEDGLQYKAKNSKGKMELIREIGWASEDEEPTHVILMITAGNQGAFIGTVGNTVWVDNIKFEY